MQTKSGSSNRKIIPCESCPIRKRAQANPRTWIARLWRWHTSWCPGWKAYQACLAEQAKQQV
jgi:hypothetical protein